MADNVAITSGTGTTVATDDVAGVHFQRMKLVDGTLDSTTPVAATEAGLFSVAHRDLVRISVTVPGITTATTAYTSGDIVGTIITMPNAARISGGSGLIVGAMVTDASDIIGAYDVMVFDRTVTVAADNAAAATLIVSDADLLFMQTYIQLTGAFDVGVNRVTQALNLAIPYVCNGTSLFCTLITRAAHTFFAANALTLTLFCERN